ncbi:MAG: hypothetical protein U5O15_08155 [Candidatus Krumholzibacteriota bacterium]|nr:hypothetical protein [Candidatus Krumholzibacteriota bacterium]
MRSGDKFIELFNKLETTLRQKVNWNNHKSFYQLVNVAAKKYSVVHRNRDILKDFGNLRNAIVHDTKYPKKILADPRRETLDSLENVFEAITNPKKVIPKFQKDIKVFSLEEKLTKVLKYMGKNDFSQVVVYNNEHYQTLSSEAIVGWLRSAIGVGIADLEGSKVENSLIFEDEKTCEYLSRNEPIDSAFELFEKAIQRNIPRLQAILVSESGKSDQKPFGLITPWDLLSINGEDTNE